ncbi:PP2C family protein-serine/threonine phosphatase [Piscinibacter sakaiensis]|uniref:PP2C family protein-serine/threonine phosphatase n=1 Tax=Piscinibacter sakaiensis TaxID=1547922 RepID=UPI003AAC868B
MRFSVYQISRKGGREKNEDRVGYSYTRASGLFVVADGMGGHPEGEVAAQLALQTIARRFQREAAPRLREPQAFLQEAIIAGHHQLQIYGERKGMNDTPRTTIVACVLQGNQACWAHCGDSRLYLVRNQALLKRTRDHSFAELERAKPVGERSERFNRNVLFTCLGSPGMPVIDVGGPVELQPGDRLLLCSDGLWGTVREEEIVEGLARGPLDDALQTLVQLALRNGGARCDNVTTLAVDWEAADDDAGDTTPARPDFDDDATIPHGLASAQRHPLS